MKVSIPQNLKEPFLEKYEHRQLPAYFSSYGFYLIGITGQVLTRNYTVTADYDGISRPDTMVPLRAGPIIRKITKINPLSTQCDNPKFENR